MEFSWTTFVLEVVNFLVLVAILQWLLYKPVLRVIAERKAAIDATLADAERARSEAASLQRQYDARASDWEAEKARAQTALEGEIAAERVRSMAALQDELDEERAKRRALQDQENAAVHREAEMRARAQGARFVSRLLQRLASPSLEAQILELAIEDLEALSAERREALQVGLGGDEATPIVTTCYPLSPPERVRVTGTLARILARALEVRFVENATVIAGIRVEVGPWMLRANLADELHTFAERDFDVA